MSLPNVIKDRDYLTRRMKRCLRCGKSYLATDHCGRRAEHVKPEDAGTRPKRLARKRPDYAAILFCSKRCDEVYVKSALAKWAQPRGASVKVGKNTKPAILGVV